MMLTSPRTPKPTPISASATRLLATVGAAAAAALLHSRARSVPDRVVISGESRILADTSQALSPAKTEVRRLGRRSLQAEDQVTL
jgi:hypothetical protein